MPRPPSLTFLAQSLRTYPHLEEYDPPAQILLCRAIDLFRLPSPSGLEQLVSTYLLTVLEQAGFTVIRDPMGNLLATRGHPASGEGYPLLSCHLDSVQPIHTSMQTGALRLHINRLQARAPKEVSMREKRITSNGKWILGGDNKCGCAIALSIAELTASPLKICCSVQEELGSRGIRGIDPPFFGDVSYALVLDHPGCQELVTRERGHFLCSQAFAKEVFAAAKRLSHQTRPVEAILPAARVLREHIPEVVGLSVGYSQGGTLQEYVRIDDLIFALAWTRECLQRLPRTHSSGSPLLDEMPALQQRDAEG